MSQPDPSPLLSAAECAARTGLSTRALRLYEEQGLIAPRRSTGGWRQYGAEELVRLNSITLLKAAGLTLAQIAGLMEPGERQPTLSQLLAIQLDTWRSRRADAERGQRIVEVALERVRSDGPLTIDDLCNLIRSLEMPQSLEPAMHRTAESDPTLDEALLGQYAGQYQGGEWSVITIRTDGSRLLIELPGRPGMELRPTSECDFEAIGPELAVTFDRGSDGAVSSLRLRLKGGDMPAARIDAATADQVRARLAERIRESRPLPGSEAAAHRLVESLLDGRPHYEEMHPALAYATRWQLPFLRTLATQLGAIQSMSFQGVGHAGWDVYDIQHEHGKSRCRIALRSDGLIVSALLQVTDGPISLGP
ncbi:MAG: MerR family transcriptional regulator [Steroidobacteraceae bacterium]